MHEQELISIIIPIFNGGKYLKECIDGVLAQDHSNIEVILVDDGSTDSTSDICRAYALQDARVRFIQQENGGVSKARNTGLDAANGDWIMFVDADDIVSEEICSTLLSLAKSEDADISIGDVIKFRGAEPKPQNRERGDRYMNGAEYLQMLAYRETSCYPVGCLYSRTILCGIRFTEGVPFGEDLDFLLRCIHDDETIAVTSRILYYYRQHADSAVNSYFRPEKLSVIDLLETWEKYFAEDEAVVKGLISRRFVASIDFLGRIHGQKGFENEKNRLWACVRQTRMTVLKDGRNTWMVRTMAVMSLLCPGLLILLSAKGRRFLHKRV